MVDERELAGRELREVVVTLKRIFDEGFFLKNFPQTFTQKSAFKALSFFYSVVCIHYIENDDERGMFLFFVARRRKALTREISFAT